MGLTARRSVRMSAMATGVLWLAAQIIAVAVYWNAPQYSDAANYLSFAREAQEAGTWYPTAEMFDHNMWIANTGYINLLVLNLKLFGSASYVGLQQLVLNVVLLLSFRKLVSKLSNDHVADLASIIYCLMPTTALMVVALMSDIPCMALIMLSLSLVRRELGMLAIAGFIGALANWIRPIGLIYWPSLFLFGLLKKAPLKYYAAYVCGMLVCVSCVGGLTYFSSGHFLTGSTTKGTNMIMGCWDGASGKYDSRVFDEGNPGYIPESVGFNVVQTDSCLTARSVEWIIENPVRFVELIPRKMFYLWASDDYVYKVLSEDSIKSAKEQVSMSAVFYVMLLLSMVGIFMSRKKLTGEAGIILLPVLLGCGMHMLMYGGLRYHYPMIFPLIYFAAVAVGNRKYLKNAKTQMN